MSRQIRIQYPGAWYHVNHRGAARQRVFENDIDRRTFLSQVGVTYERYNLEVHSYCLMTNHYHLLVRTPDGNLADAMRHLNSTYTQIFNRAHEIDGPLFKGRYSAQLVQDDEYLTTAMRYVHLNAYKAKLETELGEYKWSSLPAYLQLARPQSWLKVAEVFGRFERSVDRFASFVRAGITPESPVEETGSLILGSPEFSVAVTETLQPDTESRPSHRSAQYHPTLTEVETAVSRVWRCDPAEVRVGGQGSRNRQRMAVLSLACELTGLSQRDLAGVYGYKNYKGVATAIYRAKALRHADSEFKLRLAEAAKLLSAPISGPAVIHSSR